MTGLHEFIETGDDIEGLRELLAGGENPNSQDGSGRTPLYDAVLKSEKNPQDTDEILAVVRELINSGADVDLEDKVGCTPLHLAVMCRNCKMIELLLQTNAGINKRDNYGRAALHFATTICTFRRMDETFYDPDPRVVKLLLNYHPDLDIRNLIDETPLMLAVQNSNLHIVRELIEKGASVNLQSSSGDTALHYALDLIEVNVDVVFELARRGSSFNLRNNERNTPRKTYFEKLLKYHPPTEVEKAKSVLKLFMLRGDDFHEFEEKCIRKIHKSNKKCKLIRFLASCFKECLKMHRDRPVPNCSVYRIALRGAFSRGNDFPYKAFSEVLEDKLLKGKYPAYCDVIATGICRIFMKQKFAEKCCNTETGFGVFDSDQLKSISPYLSNFDLLNMMIACVKEESSSRPRSWWRRIW